VRATAASTWAFFDWSALAVTASLPSSIIARFCAESCTVQPSGSEKETPKKSFL
jgi:hypothetical protein